MGAAASAQGGKPADASDISDLAGGVTEVVAMRTAAAESKNEDAVAMLNDRPADGSDITTVEEAKAEVARLRRLAGIIATEAPACSDITVEVSGKSLTVSDSADFMAIKDEEGEEGGCFKLGIQIQAIPAAVFTQAGLTELNLRGNALGSLPADIGTLVFLQTLNVAECQLKSLPDELGKLCRLMELDCSDNSLTGLPTTIGGCASLNNLYCYKNKISKIPDELAMCSQLQEINFFNNLLRALPESMKDLTELVEVNVAGNAKLKYLPPTDKWTKVTLLAAQWDGLNDTFWSMKSKFSLETMVSLEQLQLDHNKGLNALPAMGPMPNMKKLVLGAMKALKALPESLGTAVQLESLDCNGCAIETIPDGIGNCAALQILNIGSNPKIKALPATIGNCSELKTLMAFGTGLTTLPGSLAKCSKVERANFKGCQLNMGDADTAAVVAQFKKSCGANFMM